MDNTIKALYDDVTAKFFEWSKKCFNTEKNQPEVYKLFASVKYLNNGVCAIGAAEDERTTMLFTLLMQLKEIITK